MKSNYKHASACLNNSRYSRGNTGISIMNKRALATLCKNADISITEIKGDYNGYGYPIIDKTITKNDIKILNKYILTHSTTAKQKEQLASYQSSPEDIIIDKAQAWLDNNYPSSPQGTLYSIIEQWEQNGRRISQDMIGRLHMLLRAYVRHAYTNYDNYECGDTDRGFMRQQFNAEAQHIIEEWKEGEKHGT